MSAAGLSAGTAGLAVGLRERWRGSRLRLCRVSLHCPGPGALKDGQTSGPGGGRMLLGSHPTTGRSRENADPNWAGREFLLVLLGA